MKTIRPIRFLLACVLLLFAADHLQARTNNDDHGVLVANTLSIPFNRTYRMYVKKYNTATQNHINKGERIVIRYASEDSTIVLPQGNAFKSVGNGSARLKLLISGAYPGTLDAFDPNNILDEIPFTVEVKDHVDMPFPQFSVSWGQEKSKTMSEMLQSGAYTNYTADYWAMNPKIGEQDRDGLEIFSTQNAEFPFLMLAFTPDEDELCAVYLLAASWERVTTPQISEVYKLLAANGFKDRGMNPDTHCWQMYNPTSKTLATCGLMIVQGCGYCYVGLSYLPEDPDPSSIQMARADQPNIVCEMKDGLLSIEAEQYVGRQLAVYTLDGKCLRVATIRRGVNQVGNLPRQPLFLRIDQCAAVKILP